MFLKRAISFNRLFFYFKRLQIFVAKHNYHTVNTCELTYIYINEFFSSSQSEVPKPKPLTAADVPKVKLNNGFQMPVVGLGTWGSPKDEVYSAVMHAIDVGYRHIDCAHIYDNEHAVGSAIKQKIAEGAVKRRELFVTSKLWNTFHRPDLVRGACEASLKNLGLNYLDMYLIHWPMAYKEENGLFPLDACGRVIFSTVDYVDTWAAMEKLVRIGYCRSIGLSNFNENQVNRVLEESKIIPAVNQVECHPYLNQKKLIAHCKSKKIAVTAYSPLGSPKRPWAKPDEPMLLQDPQIRDIAKKLEKTPAQILLRYQFQRGIAAIPKSITMRRIRANLNIFDFALSYDILKRIDKLNRDCRFVRMNQQVSSHMHYPFTEGIIKKKGFCAKKKVKFLDNLKIKYKGWQENPIPGVGIPRSAKGPI